MLLIRCGQKWDKWFVLGNSDSISSTDGIKIEQDKDNNSFRGIKI